jgi:hypothetical protein
VVVTEQNLALFAPAKRLRLSSVWCTAKSYAVLNRSDIKEKFFNAAVETVGSSEGKARR